MKYGKHFQHSKRKNAVAMLWYTLLISMILIVLYMLLVDSGLIV